LNGLFGDSPVTKFFVLWEPDATCEYHSRLLDRPAGKEYTPSEREADGWPAAIGKQTAILSKLGVTSMSLSRRLFTRLLLPSCGVSFYYYCRQPLLAAEISGPAIIERRGKIVDAEILGVYAGAVTAKGSFSSMKYNKGEVTKIWLHRTEAIPGIHDPLRIKYTYDRKTKKFLPRNKTAEIEVGAWRFDQKSKLIKEIIVETFLVDGVIYERETPVTRTIWAADADASAVIKNSTDRTISAHLTLEINSGAGHANTTAHLGPYEEKPISINFPTGSKQVSSVKLADYEVTNA
jgi:hypothetical protein